MENIAYHNEPVNEDFLSYHSGRMQETGAIVDSARNNLSNYHSKIVSALGAEEHTEDLFIEKKEKYHEALDSASDILDDLGSKIRNIRVEIRSLKASGTSSATMAEYKGQLADVIGDYEDVSRQLSYMADSMESAHASYIDSVSARQTAERELSSMMDSYASPVPASDDIDFHKIPSGIEGIVAKKPDTGLAEILEFKRN